MPAVSEVQAGSCIIKAHWLADRVQVHSSTAVQIATTTLTVYLLHASGLNYQYPLHPDQEVDTTQDCHPKHQAADL